MNDRMELHFFEDNSHCPETKATHSFSGIFSARNLVLKIRFQRKKLKFTKEEKIESKKNGERSPNSKGTVLLLKNLIFADLKCKVRTLSPNIHFQSCQGTKNE